jgi:hypothetical protein
MVLALTEVTEPNVVKFGLGITPVNVDFVGIARNLHCWLVCLSVVSFLREQGLVYIFFARRCL